MSTFKETYDPNHTECFIHNRPHWREDKTSFFYGDMMACFHQDQLNQPNVYFLHPLLSYSDYSGSIVEFANFAKFMELYGNLPGVVKITGDYFSVALGINIHNEYPQEMIDTLNALADYPVIDDEFLSQTEMEQVDEYMISNQHHFIHLIEEHRGQVFVNLDDEQYQSIVMACLQSALNKANCSDKVYRFETGMGSLWLNEELVVEQWKESILNEIM